MDFFLTFTCNQSDHFGVSKVKNCPDSRDWEKYISGFDDLSDIEIKELRNGMEQSAGGLILRVWMEIRKIFIDYLCNSTDSPFYPVDAIFSIDEYQDDFCNLPHIHMMISMKSDVMTGSQKEKWNI